jgi:hypothetical protein
MILRQPAPVVDVPNFEEPIDIPPIEKVEPAAITEGKTLPKQGLSAEMKGADETLQTMIDVSNQGGFNKDSLIKSYGKEITSEIENMRKGLVKTDGNVSIDKYAQEKGIDAETLKNNILDFKKTSITKKGEVNFIKENIIDKEKAKQDLLKNGYEPAQSIEVYNLEKGDQVVRNGEEFSVTGEKDGNLILKDGETIKVPLDETLDIDGVKKQTVKTEKTKAGNQVTINGTSEAENFSLDNPETEWSKKLPEQVNPKNEDLFAEKPEIETDAARVQEIKNSIAEGEMILKSGKKTSGEKYSQEALAAIQRSVDKSKAKIGITLNSGLDITQTIDVLKGLTSNIKEAIPHLETLGRNVYEDGKKTYSEWRGQMQTHLGDLWESFKDHLKAIWDQIKKTIGNEKGAVGKDINDPIIKQRSIGKDKDKRTAPAIRKSEFEVLRDMPELRQKPLGGWIENPIRTFEELGPQIKEIFYRPVKEAEHAAKIQFQKIHEQSEKLRKSLPSKSSERIGIFAIFKQSGGEEILAKMGIKNIPELSPREMKVYEWMRKGLETYYNKLQEARAAAGKEKFGHVEDYFTFARQMTLIEQLGFSPIFSREKLLSNFMHRKTTPFRFEKHRVGGLSRADLDAFGVFNRYMESATRHVNLSPAIAKGREMMNTFKDVDGENWILRDEKPSAAKFITEWLDFQAGQRKPQLPNLIEKGLTKLNKNLAFSILSANIRSALIQPTAIVNTAAEIGPKWTYAGIKSILDNSGMEKSNVLFSRQFDVNVSESLAGMPGKIGKAKQVLGNLGMKPLQFLDMQTAKATWNGAYKKGLSEGMNERTAINYADDVVTKTQGSAMPSDMAPIQRTALGKAISMFQTFVINQWGFLTRDVLGIKNANINNKMMFKKVAAFVIGTTLFNILYEDILGIPSPMPSPINAFMKSLEKDDDIPSASLDAALEIAQLAPVAGGGLRYGSSMLGAPAEYIGDIGKKLSPNYTGFTRPTGELIGKGLGIPGTSQIGKIIRINDKGGSVADMALGRYPKEEHRKLKRVKLKKREKIKGI